MLDEVRVYDRALTDAEVSTLATSYTTYTCTWKSSPATTDWNTASNWVEGRVPLSNDNAVVNTCTPNNYPVLPSNIRVNNLTINNGGGLNLQGNRISVANDTQCSYATIQSANGYLRSGSYSYVYRVMFEGPITVEKTAWTKSHWRGGNLYTSTVTLINAATSDSFFTANWEGDTYKGDATFFNYGAYMYISYSTSGTTIFEGKATMTDQGLGYQSLLGICLNAIYHKAVEINNYSTATCGIGGGGTYLFKGPVSLNNFSPPGSSAYNNSMVINGACTFKDAVKVSNSNIRTGWVNPHKIEFGSGTNGACLFEPTARLEVGTNGFLRGDLILRNCTFQNPNPITLNLSSGGTPEVNISQIIIGTGTSFTGPVQITAPRIQLNGGVFNQDVTLTKTGNGADNSTGGNTFKKKLTVINNANASSPLNLATQANDLVQQ